MKNLWVPEVVADALFIWITLLIGRLTIPGTLFSRIPFYEDFEKWADWGKKLMELHIGYETIEPFALEEITAETKSEHLRQKTMFNEVQEPQALFARQPKIKPKLKADKETVLS